VKTLLSFLEGAPKTALTSIHQRFVGKKGLLSGSKILSESLEAILAPERMDEWLANLELWQKDCLHLIYASLDRGLTSSELLLAVPTDQQAHLHIFLLDAAERLCICRVTAPGLTSYYPFQEFAKLFAMPLNLGKDTASTRWYQHGNQLVWHLVRVCAQVLKGQVRYTATGELHRRSTTCLDECLVSTQALSEQAPADERTLILQYMSEQGWLLQEDSEIHLTSIALEGLSQHPGRLRHHICHWWLERRLGLRASEFRELMLRWQGCIDVVSFARNLWPITPYSRLPSAASTTLSWSTLPKVLRELWLLGFVELNLQQGRHSLVRIGSEATHWMEHGAWESETHAIHPPTATANFEAILSTQGPTKHLFTAACIAEPLSDESFVRIQFTKEPLLQALRAGLSEAWLQEFLTWIRLPSVVSQGMNDWISVHSGSYIRKSWLLRIKSIDRWNELSTFPQFLEHVEEAIPAWGFIIKPAHEVALRELLTHFGLEPPQEKERTLVGTPIVQGPWTKDFALPAPPQGNPDYEWRAAETRSAIANALTGQSKYNTDFQALSQDQSLKVLRYAMVMEVPIEIIMIDPSLPKAPARNATLTVLRINNRREPYRISGTDTQGSPVEITLDQIQKIRLTAI